MRDFGGPLGGYSYTYKTPEAAPASREKAREAEETLVSIKDTLMLLTGGCEITQGPQGLFCAKHGRPVRPEGNGCDYLSKHFSSRESENRSRAQLQQYVSEMLGIKNPDNVRRLTGP